MSAPLVKICGLTRPEDAMHVLAVRPDYAGLVFAAGRRKLTLERAAGLAARLPAAIVRVGVFADAEPDDVARAVTVCGLGVVQLHGGETPGYVSALQDRFQTDRVRFWKVIGVASGLEPADRGKEADRILRTASGYAGLVDGIHLDVQAGLDPATGTRPAGGTGRRIDWHVARMVVENLREPVILSGGLDPGNVAEAISSVQPRIVDVSSGVETRGRKDKDKIFSFVENVRMNKGDMR